MLPFYRHSEYLKHMVSSTNSLLSRSIFLLRGLDVLVSDGPRSLTAARMARELNVTTGSFYWHFSTVGNFRDDLKVFWRDEIVVGIIFDAKKQAGDPAKVLDEIGKIIRQRGTHRYDAAMRSWAESDRDAEEIVRTADRLRGDLIAGVLRDAGANKEQAMDKASLLGAAWLGSADMNPEYRFKLMRLVTHK
jgi:AcrR family transcriptional regulator